MIVNIIQADSLSEYSPVDELAWVDNEKKINFPPPIKKMFDFRQATLGQSRILKLYDSSMYTHS